MIQETADKDLLVFIFKIHILSLKLTYQKGAKIDKLVDDLETTIFRLTLAIIIIYVWICEF